jgi:hypothetical protein
MKKIKTGKRFLMIVISSFLGFTLIYLLTYDLLVKKDIFISHSYKDFLLRYTSGSRLIIDSGSNSVYGINSAMLETELGLFTINLADNAGIPLREKLYRIEQFSHPGDVVLLPLEWGNYFSETNSTTFFLDNLFTELNFYFYEMPAFIKLNLIIETPFSSVIRAAIEKSKETILVENIQNEYIQLIDYENRFKLQEKGDYKGAVIIGLRKEEQKISCDDYVLNGHEHRYILSDIFKKNIVLVNKLQQKGINIIFTWPVVTGDDCYQEKYAAVFNAFIDEIKNYLKERNILVVGEPQDSQFKRQYLLDSYYHVIPVARDMRTKKLIEVIRKSEAITWFKKTTFPKNALTISSELLKSNIFNSLPEIKNNQLIRISKDSNYFFLEKGWYPLENWGVWSNEVESVFYVKLNNNLLQHDLKLTIENDLYKVKDKTAVYINDKQLGIYFLEGKSNVVIPQYLLNNQKNGLIKIQFNHSNVKSPLEYGESEDSRKIKFGLKTLQFTRRLSENKTLERAASG